MDLLTDCWDNWIAAQHLSRYLVRPSSVYEELFQKKKKNRREHYLIKHKLAIRAEGNFIQSEKKQHSDEILQQVSSR